MKLKITENLFRSKLREVSSVGIYIIKRYDPEIDEFYKIIVDSIKKIQEEGEIAFKKYDYMSEQYLRDLVQVS